MAGTLSYGGRSDNSVISFLVSTLDMLCYVMIAQPIGTRREILRRRRSLPTVIAIQLGGNLRLLILGDFVYLWLKIMAGALSYGGLSDNSAISFLVVAAGDQCERISEGLLESSRERKCRSYVHQCESVAEVIRLKPDLSVDFIVFGFDWTVSHSIAELEENISLIDEYYIIAGCSILVNCAGVPKPFSLPFQKAREISKKLNLALMTINILEPHNSLRLGNCILNLAEARLGTKSVLPMLPRPFRDQ